MGLGNIIRTALGIAPKLKKRRFDPEKMTVNDISLPPAFMGVSVDSLRDLIKSEVDTFESLSYKDKSYDELKIEEFHSYEVGIILRYLKDDNVYKNAKIDQILPIEVVNLSYKQLHLKVFEIVHRYDDLVNKKATLKELKEDIKWSPLEVAYLIRYLTLENRKKSKI